MSFTEEKIVETKICEKSQISFNITDKDLEFYDKISPTFGGKKYSIPAPTLAPESRQQRRLSCRNETRLYSRKCDATDKSIISIYSPDKSYKVFASSYWWSDEWDATDYGLDYDLSLSFFENFKKLDLHVPKLATTIQNSENCEFTNDTGDSKDCYMSYRTHYSDNILHSYRANRSSNCTDCYQVKESEDLYECFQCNKCSRSQYLYKCENTHSSYFLYQCVGSANCFLSYNQINANYVFLNQTLSKEQYQQKLDEVLSDPLKFEQAKQHFFSMIKNDISVPALDNSQSQQCIGNELIECQECKHCYMMKQSEFCKYCWDNVGYKNSMDTYSGGGSEYCYETLATKNSFKNCFTHRVRESNNLLYCMFSFFSNDCFGCTGIRNKQYCILNKQYSKEEYEELVPKIIEKMQQDGEWGEFFPASMSPFGYNETVAQEYFPLTKEEAIEQGFNWSDYEAPFPKVEKVIPASKLPHNITDIPDDILNWAIECEITKKPFRIIPQELKFYRKHNLPIPRRHPDQRHLDRMSLRNPRKLFERVCDHPDCDTTMQTTYAPDRSESVYCQTCYDKEVY
ncbi:hypothetical protein MK079_01460 [Candidatus Gracilibacteria bacterium]|nr:hypothetical protein [Candidatus Gracilibacteria bacterium]